MTFRPSGTFAMLPNLPDIRSVPSPLLPPGAAAVVDTVLERCLAAVIARRPALARRLAALPAARLLVEPADLPIRFMVGLGASGTSVRVATEDGAASATTRVRAPFRQLLALAQARIDADAIFFDRTLVIDGDAEPVVALRNVLESEPVDLAADVLAALGPLAGPARELGLAMSGVAQAVGRAAEVARDALLAPIVAEVARLEREVGRLASAIDGLAAPPRRRGRIGG